MASEQREAVIRLLGLLVLAEHGEATLQEIDRAIHDLEMANLLAGITPYAD
jgi:hypothetical protein